MNVTNHSNSLLFSFTLVSNSNYSLSVLMASFYLYFIRLCSNWIDDYFNFLIKPKQFALIHQQLFFYANLHRRFSDGRPLLHLLTFNYVPYYHVNYAKYFLITYLTHFLNEYCWPLNFHDANYHFYVINYHDLLNAIISEDLLNDYFRQALILILWYIIIIFFSVKKKYK